MLHFQECGQNQFPLARQLEAMLREMMFQQVEFFDGFRHGWLISELGEGVLNPKRRIGSRNILN